MGNFSIGFSEWNGSMLVLKTICLISAFHSINIYFCVHLMYALSHEGAMVIEQIWAPMSSATGTLHDTRKYFECLFLFLFSFNEKLLQNMLRVR